MLGFWEFELLILFFMVLWGMSNVGILYCILIWFWCWLFWLVVLQLLVILVWVLVGWYWGLLLMVVSYVLFMVLVFLFNSCFYVLVLSWMFDFGNSVWLIIDDGFGLEICVVFDLLDCYQVYVIFFLVGECVLVQLELVQEILCRGYDLGNYSYSYLQVCFWWLGLVVMCVEIEGCQYVLQVVGGCLVCWYCLVVGMINLFVVLVLQWLGLVWVGWSVCGFDGIGCMVQGVFDCLLLDLCLGVIVLLYEGVVYGYNLVIIEGVLQVLDECGLKVWLLVL